MADRKVTVEVTDNKSLDGLLKKVDALNTALAKTEALGKSVRVGGSVAAGKALGSTGVPADEFGQYRNARAAVGTGAAGRDFARQAQGLGGLVHIYATFAANIFAVGAAFNALKKAMDFSVMEQSLSNLSASIGTNLKTISDEMVRATQGAIAMQDAMKFTAMAATAGMSAKQIKDLTTAAKGASAALGRDLADAMDRMFRGVVKMEPELLDELGIMTKANDAYKEYARSVGKSVEALSSFEKRMSFTNAVISEAQQKFGALAGKVDVNAYSKALAQLQNVALSIGGAINSILGPIVNLFGESKTLMAGFIAAITGILLKQAVPALTSWRSSLKETAAQSDESFKRMVQNARDGATAYASAFSKAAGAAQAGVDKTLAAARNSNLQNLKDSVAGSFKSGKLLEDIKSQVTLQDALVKLKEKEGFIENQLKRAKAAEQTATGAAKTAALNRVNHLEVVQRYLTGQHTELERIAALERESAKWAQERAAAEQTAARALSGSAQRKINAAENRSLINQGVAKVGEQASLFGSRIAFEQLGKEIQNFNDKKLETGPLSKYENAMRRMGVASLALRGSLVILGTAIAGLASALMSVFAIVGIFYMALEGLASVTGGNSKTIEAFADANQNLKASIDNVSKALAVQKESQEKGLTGFVQYIANQERLANATEDLKTRLQEASYAAQAFANESGGWWSKAKQGIAKLFDNDEVTKFAENVRGAASALYDLSNGKAFADMKDYYTFLQAAREATSMEELIRLNNQLIERGAQRGKVERANAETVRGAVEFWKLTTDEMRKHETEAQKTAKVYSEVTAAMNEQSNAIKNGDTERAFSTIAGIASKIDLDLFKRTGNQAAINFIQGFENAMAASGQKITDRIDGSAAFGQMINRAQEYQNTSDPKRQGEIRAQAQETFSKLIQDANQAFTTVMEGPASAEAKELAKAGYIKFVTSMFAVLQGDLAPEAIKNVLKDYRTSGQKTAVDRYGNEVAAGLGDKGNQGAVANARTQGRGEKYKADENALKALREEARLLKEANDLAERQVKTAIRRSDILSDEVFTQYGNNLLAQATAEFEAAKKQIELDDKRARDAKQFDAATSSKRLQIAYDTYNIAKEEANVRQQNFEATTRIAELERDLAPQKSRLAILDKYNDALAKANIFSTQELADRKASLTYEKEKLAIQEEYKKAVYNSLGNQDQITLATVEKDLKLKIIEAEKQITIEQNKQQAIAANINAQITARDTLINNAVTLNNGIVTSQEALVLIEQNKAAFAEQTARAYIEQVRALGAAATEQDRQRLAIAAIATLQQKNLDYLQQQVVLWDRSGQSMKAFEASFGLMIAKTRSEAKGAGVIMAEALNAGIETAVDKMFDTLKEKGKLTFKELARGVGNSIRDSILDGVKSSVKADIKGAIGGLLGITDPEEEAKRQAIEQFKVSIRTQQEQINTTLQNTKALLNLTAVEIKRLESEGKMTDKIQELADVNSAQINAIEAQIGAMKEFADDISKAISSIGGKSGGTLSKVMNLFGKVATGYLQGGTQGAVNAGASSLGGPVGSLLSNGYSIYTGTSAAGSFATNFGLGVYGAEGGTGIGALAGEYAASLMGEGAAGMLASGMSFLAAAMPYVAVALALYQIFGKKGGGPKSGGSFMGKFDATTGRYIEDQTVPGTDNGRFFTPNQSDSEARKMGEAMGTGYADTLKKLGGKGNGTISFGAAWDRDPNGTAGNRTSFLVQDSQGKTLYENRDAGAGKSDEDLTKALQLESQRSILAALRASDLPKEVSEILNSIDIKTATVEDIDKTIKSAIDMSEALTAIADVDIAGLDITKLKEMVVGSDTLMQTLNRVKAVFDSTARIGDAAFGAVGIASYDAREALIKAAGGLDSFAGKMQDFYSKFYSEGENFTYSTTQLRTSLSQLGLTSIPQTKEAYRALMEAQDLSTEAGRTLYAQLLNLAPAFDQVVGAIERTSAALGQMNMDAQDQLLLDTLDEQGKYNFWKSRAEELASSDSFKNLKSPEEIQAKYEAAQNAAMNAWNAMDEQGKKENLGGFQAFLKALLDNANSRLTELGLDATVGPGGTPGAAAAQKTPAEKLVEASTTAAETLAEAFTVGADKIVAALGGTSPSGLTDPSRDALADALERRARNDEARRAEQDNARGQMDNANAEAMRQAAEMMREAAELIRQGGGEINAAAGRPIQVEVTNNESHVNR